MNTIQIEAASDLKETIARIEVLDREIGMLRQIHCHLSGIARHHNDLRIAERQEELATWVYLMGVQERLVG